VVQWATVYVVEDQTIVNREEYEIEHPTESLHKQQYEMGVGDKRREQRVRGVLYGPMIVEPYT